MSLIKNLGKGLHLGTKKEKVTNENFEESLFKSVNEVIEYTRGERALRTHVATYFRMPPRYSNIQYWEKGQREMPAPACRVLELIEKDPDTVFSLTSDDKVS